MEVKLSEVVNGASKLSFIKQHKDIMERAPMSDDLFSNFITCITLKSRIKKSR